MLNAISDRLGLVGLLQQRHAQLRGDPPAGSMAAGEYQRPGGVHAYHHAIGRLGGANDHVLALGALIRDAKILPAFAGMTLLRGAYEAALVARWVVDGTPDERLAKGISLHFDDLVERDKFERSCRMPPAGAASGPGKRADERIGELLDVAEPYGVVRTDDKGRRSVRPVAPTYTRLAETYPAPESGEVDEEWFYRFLSAYAHSKQWALILTAQDIVHGAGDTSDARIEADDRWVMWTLERVWAQLDAAFSAIETLWSPPHRSEPTTENVSRANGET